MKAKLKRQSGDFVLPTEVIIRETPGIIPEVETEIRTIFPFFVSSVGIILTLSLVLFVLIIFCVLLFKKCRSMKDCSVKQENPSLDTDHRSPKTYTPSLQSSSKERLKSVAKSAKQEEDSASKKTSPPSPLPPPVFLVKRDESQEVRKIKSTGSHMSKGSTMSSGTPRSLIGSKHKQSIKGKGPAPGTSITTVPRSAYGGSTGSTSLLGTVNLNNNTSLRPQNYVSEKKMKDKSVSSFASAKSSNTTESSSTPTSGGVSASLKKEVKADPLTTEKPSVQETVKNTPKV